MINKFLVEVRKNSVIVYCENDLANVHYRAKIDGMDYAYHIIRNTMTFNKPCDDWFKRGGQHVRYHAQNQGKNIQWLPVSQEFKYRAMAQQNREGLFQWHVQKK